MLLNCQIANHLPQRSSLRPSSISLLDFVARLMLVVLVVSNCCGCRPVDRIVQMGHASGLSRAEFSSDGRFLLTVSRDGEAILWDARSGHPLRILYEIDKEPTRRLVELNPNSQQVLVQKIDSESGVARLTLQAIASGETIRVLDDSDDVPLRGTTLFSRDGRYVCSLDNRPSGTHAPPVRVWDVQTGSCLWSPGMSPPYNVEQLESLQNEIETAGAKFDSTAAAKATYVAFLRNFRADGLPLTFSRPSQIGWNDGLFGPDGRYFLSREEDSSTSTCNAITLWNGQSGKPIKLFHSLDELDERLFQPNGQSFLVGCQTTSIRELDSATGELIREFTGHTAKIACLAYSFDGKTILSGDDEGTAILWDVATAMPLRKWRSLRSVVSLAYRTDCQRVLISLASGKVIEYDVDQSQPRMKLNSRGGAIVEYSPDGQRILTRNHACSMLWDADTGNPIVALDNQSVQRLSLSPNGEWAASLGDQPLKLWSTRTGQLSHTFSNEELRPLPVPNLRRVTITPVDLHQEPVAQHPRGWLPASSDRPKVPSSAIDAARSTAQLDQHAIEWLAKTDSTSVSLANATVQTGFFFQNVSTDGTAFDHRIERLERGQLVHEFRAAPLKQTAATLTRDGGKLIVAYIGPVAGEDNKLTLIIWNAETGERLRTIDISLAKSDAHYFVKHLILSPDERYLVLGHSYHVVLLDLATELSFDLGPIPESSQPFQVMFSSDSRFLLVRAARNLLWDLAEKKQIADVGGGNIVHRPRFSPNGQYLFVSSNDSSVGPSGTLLIDCKTGSRQRLQDVYSTAVFSASGDRLLLLDGSLREAELWDFNAGRLIKKLAVSGGGGIREACLMPDQSKFLTLHEKALVVWDFDSGKMLHAHIDQTLNFAARTDCPPAFFLSNQQRLITVHDSGANVWEAASGRLIHRLQTVGSHCVAAIEGPEAKTLLTVSPGSKAVLWNLDTGREQMVFRDVPADIYPAHNEVWFSSDGRQLFARHRAGQAVIAWDVRTGKISQRYYLVNDGDDLLVELPGTGQYIGAPRALAKVVTVGAK